MTILTVAGDEPEAAIGLAQLAEMGDLIHQRAPSTVTYGHSEVRGRRVLTYLVSAGPIAPPVLADPPDVALLAPIADELPASAIGALRESARPRLTVLLIQGWLRRLAIGEPARPLALDEVPAATWEAFAAADAIVVSTEDLAESPGGSVRRGRRRAGKDRSASHPRPDPRRAGLPPRRPGLRPMSSPSSRGASSRACRWSAPATRSARPSRSSWATVPLRPLRQPPRPTASSGCSRAARPRRRLGAVRVPRGARPTRPSGGAGAAVARR